MPNNFKVGNYLVKWADGTISILFSSNEMNLFWNIDEEANPMSDGCKIYFLPKYFHIKTFINDKNKIYAWMDCHKLKRFMWTKGIEELAHISSIKIN